MTYKQALELIEKGAIIKYDDMFLIRQDKYGRIETSLDGIHWVTGLLYYDPPMDYSIFKIVRI